jgi:hypothetical protein
VAQRLEGVVALQAARLGDFAGGAQGVSTVGATLSALRQRRAVFDCTI